MHLLNRYCNYFVYFVAHNKLKDPFMAKKKEKKAGKRMKKSELAERLINYFRAKPNVTFSLKQL